MQLCLNEADTLKCSSILIYSHREQSNNTHCDFHNAVLIERVRLKDKSRINLREV
jgi:hypothetical protein